MIGENSLMKEKIYVLHLSDIHLGTNEQGNIYYSQLQLDLTKNLKIDHLDYLLISGDIANKSTKDEYDAAITFINKLKEKFNLNNERIIVSPGNHDLNWQLSASAYDYIPKFKLPSSLTDAYIPDSNGASLRNENKYKKRFDYFSKFYQQVTGSQYPSSYEEQAILHIFKEDKLLILNLNSCWQIDHHYTKRASINPSALASAIDKTSGDEYEDWLKVAIWHHPTNGQETMNAEFLGPLIVAGFEICLHGHIHEAIEDFHKYDDKRGLAIIGGGTFGAPAKAQTTGIPLQYNLLAIEPNKASFTVNSRKKEKPDGAWSADARWGDKEAPKAYYTIELKKAYQQNSNDITNKVTERLPEVASEANKKSAINLMVHNWTYEKFDIEPDYELDWSSHFDYASRRLPDPQVWENDLLVQLNDLKKKILRETATRFVRFRGKCCLSTGVVLGATFPINGSWVFEVQQPPNQMWYSNAEPIKDYQLVVKKTDLSLANLDPNATVRLDSKDNSLACIFNITGNAENEVVDFIKQQNLSVKAIISIQPTSPGTTAITNDIEAVSFAIAARDALKQALLDYRVSSMHLFFFGPLGLSIFVGQRLTSMGIIHLYEFKRPGYVLSAKFAS